MPLNVSHRLSSSQYSSASDDYGIWALYRYDLLLPFLYANVIQRTRLVVPGSPPGASKLAPFWSYPKSPGDLGPVIATTGTTSSVLARPARWSWLPQWSACAEHPHADIRCDNAAGPACSSFSASFSRLWCVEPVPYSSGGASSTYGVAVLGFRTAARLRAWRAD